MAISGENLVQTRTLFLRLVSVCYSTAFISLYSQIPGLYGPDGILPVHMILGKTDKVLSLSKLTEKMAERPTLLLGAGYIGISPDNMMELLCLMGAMISFLSAVAPSYGGKLNYLVLWLYYMSIFQVGQTFMWFQWDTLLLEVGFLCIIVAPMWGSNFSVPSPQDHISVMLVRWLLFRMMFASGIVKLTSGCPAWWGLSALPLHYESQCIPTPLAWYAHRWMPEVMHQMSVVVTYLIEIPLTFLFFAPTRWLRKLTFVAQVFLMVTIMATGNYNFFNLLFIALCVSLMDDSWIRKGDGVVKSSSWIVSKLILLFNLIATSAIVYIACVYFVKLSNDGTLMFEPKINFSKKQFAKFVTSSTKVGIILGGMSLASASVLALYKSLFPSDEFSGGRSGIFRRLYNLLVTLCYIGVGYQMFTASIPVFARGLGEKVPNFVPKASDLMTEKVDQLNLMSSYGLFRQMTGIGGRPEIIIEGAETRSGPWKEYNFLYKPGNVSQAPKFCLPHQPRLDWQMWFAALGSAEQNPWLLSLVYRLLQNKKSVVGLLDQSQNPFPNAAPKLIRAKLFHYRFAENVDNQTDWWTREEKKEYLPLFSVDHEPLVQYLEKAGILSTSKTAPKTRLRAIRVMLKFLRKQAAKVEPHVLVWSIGWLALPILYPILGVF